VYTDTVAETVSEHIYINNMDTTEIKSNKELYNQMCDYLRRACVTEIDTLQDRYKVYIDYTIIDQCNATDNHQIAINDMTAENVAILLGVGANNELVYRQGRFLSTEIEFAISNVLPIGIMKRKAGSVKFRVNDLVIYQDGSTLDKDSHNSIQCCCYEPKTTTIISALENYVPVFSAINSGIIFENLICNFNPRKIKLDIKFIYSDLIVAYDDKEVNDIITENIRRKYHPDDPVDPDTGEDDDGHVIPDSDIYPDADGCTCPDKDGWFDYYEKCSSTTPKALMVVEDLIPDTVFDSSTMIRKKKVIKDIPDITVGDFVIYRTGLVPQGEGGCNCHPIPPTEEIDPDPEDNPSTEDPGQNDSPYEHETPGSIDEPTDDNPATEEPVNTEEPTNTDENPTEGEPVSDEG
jgi:hypothetical protein